MRLVRRISAVFVAAAVLCSSITMPVSADGDSGDSTATQESSVATNPDGSLKHTATGDTSEHYICTDTNYTYEYLDRDDFDFNYWDGSTSLSWFLDHSGTKEDPFVISSAADLMGLYRASRTVSNSKTAFGTKTYKKLKDQSTRYAIWCFNAATDTDGDVLNKVMTDVPLYTDTITTDDIYNVEITKHVQRSTNVSDIGIVLEESAPAVVTIGGVEKTYTYLTKAELHYTLSGDPRVIDLLPYLKSKNYAYLSGPSKSTYASEALYNYMNEPALCATTALEYYTPKFEPTVTYNTRTADGVQGGPFDNGYSPTNSFVTVKFAGIYMSIDDMPKLGNYEETGTSFNYTYTATRVSDNAAVTLSHLPGYYSSSNSTDIVNYTATSTYAIKNAYKIFDSDSAFNNNMAIRPIGYRGDITSYSSTGNTSSYLDGTSLDWDSVAITSIPALVPHYQCFSSSGNYNYPYWLPDSSTDISSSLDFVTLSSDWNAIGFGSKTNEETNKFNRFNITAVSFDHATNLATLSWAVTNYAGAELASGTATANISSVSDYVYALRIYYVSGTMPSNSATNYDPRTGNYTIVMNVESKADRTTGTTHTNTLTFNCNTGITMTNDFRNFTNALTVSGRPVGVNQSYATTDSLYYAGEAFATPSEHFANVFNGYIYQHGNEYFNNYILDTSKISSNSIVYFKLAADISLEKDPDNFSNDFVDSFTDFDDYNYIMSYSMGIFQSINKTINFDLNGHTLMLAPIQSLTMSPIELYDGTLIVGGAVQGTFYGITYGTTGMSIVGGTTYLHNLTLYDYFAAFEDAIPATSATKFMANPGLLKMLDCTLYVSNMSFDVNGSVPMGYTNVDITIVTDKIKDKDGYFFGLNRSASPMTSTMATFGRNILFDNKIVNTKIHWDKYDSGLTNFTFALYASELDSCIVDPTSSQGMIITPPRLYNCSIDTPNCYMDTYTTWTAQRQFYGTSGSGLFLNTYVHIAANNPDGTMGRFNFVWSYFNTTIDFYSNDAYKPVQQLLYGDSGHSTYYPSTAYEGSFGIDIRDYLTDEQCDSYPYNDIPGAVMLHSGFYNCTIKTSGDPFRSRLCLEYPNDGMDGGGYCDNVIFDIHSADCGGTWDYQPGIFYDNPPMCKDCYFKYGELKDVYALGGKICVDCAIEVDSLQLTNSLITSSAYEGRQTMIAGNNKGNSSYWLNLHYNSDILVHKLSGDIVPIGGYFLDSRMSITFADELDCPLSYDTEHNKFYTPSNSHYKYNSGYLVGTEVYFGFDESAHGYLPSLLNGSLYDSMIYIEPMPDSVEFRTQTLVTPGQISTSEIGRTASLDHTNIGSIWYRTASPFYGPLGKPIREAFAAHNYVISNPQQIFKNIISGDIICPKINIADNVWLFRFVSLCSTLLKGEDTGNPSKICILSTDFDNNGIIDSFTADRNDGNSSYIVANLNIVANVYADKLTSVFGVYDTCSARAVTAQLNVYTRSGEASDIPVSLIRLVPANNHASYNTGLCLDGEHALLPVIYHLVSGCILNTNTKSSYCTLISGGWNFNAINSPSHADTVVQQCSLIALDAVNNYDISSDEYNATPALIGASVVDVTCGYPRYVFDAVAPYIYMNAGRLVVDDVYATDNVNFIQNVTFTRDEVYDSRVLVADTTVYLNALSYEEWLALWNYIKDFWHTMYYNLVDLPETFWQNGPAGITELRAGTLPNLPTDYMTNRNSLYTYFDGLLGLFEIVPAYATVRDAISELIKPAVAEDFISGELAYNFDGGDSIYARHSYYTVVEPEYYIRDSFTGTLLYELPQMTWAAAAHVNPRAFSSNVNFGPIYKSEVKSAEGGSIELKGLNGTHTIAGDLYTKANSLIVSDVTTDNDEIMLIYALEKVGEASPKRIPNTPLSTGTTTLRGFSTSVLNSLAVMNTMMMNRSPQLRNSGDTDASYDISGYRQPTTNTVITPVFKTKRYIDVQVTNDEHGTIIPSAYVSAEGEEIHITYDCDPNYIVQNIKVNGNPLASEMFFMPDEDVLITGDCVPFECGITKFTLMGQQGIIDQIAGTIDVTIPKCGYISNALPYVEYYGDTITPDSRVDFSNTEITPVMYTVTKGDSLSKQYAVIVHQKEYTNRIYDFVLNGIHGKIDQANKKIMVTVPVGTDISNLVPDLIDYSAEEIVPAVDTARDFSIPQPYTLNTTGMAPTQYMVYVQESAPSDAYITEFVVSGYRGDINEADTSITLTVPKLYDLSDVAPSLVSYVGKSITPGKTERKDMTSEPTYTVTAQSGITRTYTVYVNYIGDNEAHIDTFKLAGADGVINQVSKVITVTLQKGTNVTGIAPDELTYTGKTIYPRVSAELDYSDDTNPVVYTVVAPDNTEVRYTVRIVFTEDPPIDPPGPNPPEPDPPGPNPPEPDPPGPNPPHLEPDPEYDALLLEYEVLGYKGVIDQKAKTVTLTFPRGVDVTNAVPSKFVISEGATATPDETIRHNYNYDFQYVVTSKDYKKTNVYTVHSIVPDDLSEDARIVEFWIDDHPGEINQETGIIIVHLPDTYTPDDIKNKVPDITWIGKTITPSDDAPQNFNDKITYTVTAENPAITKPYDVFVIIDTKEEKPWYNIILKDDPHGDIDSTVIKAHEGDPVVIWVMPDDGYEPESFTVDNKEQLPDTQVSFKMPPHDVTAEVKFVKIPVYYNIIISESLNGRVTSTHSKALEGTSVTVTAKPNTDCHLTSFVVDNVDQLPNTVDTFSMPAHDVYVSASFEHDAVDKPKYKIITEDSPHGDIDSSVPEAYEGEEVKIWITPDPGYKPDDFIVDNEEQLPATEVVIIMPPHDVTASADFSEILYKLIPEDPEHGKIISSVPEAPEGEEVWVEIIPDPGYRPTSFVVDDTERLPSYKVTFTMPPRDVYASATFEQILYHIVIDKNEHGKVTSTHVWAPEGEEVTISLEPDDGYEPTRFDIDKTNKLPNKKTTFKMPPRDVTVTVRFTEIPKDDDDGFVPTGVSLGVGVPLIAAGVVVLTRKRKKK